MYKHIQKQRKELKKQMEKGCPSLEHQFHEKDFREKNVLKYHLSTTVNRDTFSCYSVLCPFHEISEWKKKKIPDIYINLCVHVN